MMGAKRYYFQTEETVTTTRKGYVLVEEDFTQVYNSFLSVCPFLKVGTSYQLMFWIGATMTEMNALSIGDVTFKQFNKYLKEHDEQCAVSRSTFYRAVDDLVRAKILTKIGRAFYYMNPHFFWKGTQKGRIEFIQEEYKDGTTISYNPLDKDENGA